MKMLAYLILKLIQNIICIDLKSVTLRMRNIMIKVMDYKVKLAGSKFVSAT